MAIEGEVQVMFPLDCDTCERGNKSGFKKNCEAIQYLREVHSGLYTLERHWRLGPDFSGR